MKNKFLALIISFLFLYNNATANTFTFKTKNIQILKEKNQILAGKGKVFSSDNDLEISADRFDYSKNLEILKSEGNGTVLIKSKDLIINFNKATFNQKNSIIEANGNVKIYHTNENFFILSEKIIYDQLNNFINSTEKTILKDNLRIYIQ